MHFTHIKALTASLLLATTLTACGNDNLPTPVSTSTTIINGQAIAGAVTGSLTVRDGTGAQVATANVNSGVFAVKIPNASLSQTLDFEVTGTYRDEVSGQTVTLTSNDPLALRVAANTYKAGQLGHAPITPDTSIIRAMIANGMSQTAAEIAFKATFGYIPDLTAQPFDPYTTPITTQTTADQTAAFRVGVFSQLGTDLGLTAADLAELPNRFAADLADGALDGIDSLGNPVTFISGVNLQVMNQTMSLANMVSMAVAGFAASPANVAGVAAPTMGLPPIVADMPGTIKTITLADGVTQVNIKLDVPNVAPFQTGFKNVKTTHQLTITNAATGAGIDITALGSPIRAINIKPWMYMFSGHGHPTPTGAVVNTTPVSGVYTVDIYYLMATGMLMGTEVVPMGQWDLNIVLTDTTGTTPVDVSSHFFPNVMMNMAPDLLLATGNNSNDQWTDMTGVTKPREYRVWLQNITTNPAGGHDLSIYATTLGMDMSAGGMIFPPVYQGFSVMMPAYSITTSSCEVSTDGATTWQAMPMTATNGIYQITGLTGLTTGATTILDIRLTVDGNVMQTAAGGNLQLRFTAP